VPIDARGMDAATVRRLVERIAEEVGRLCKEWELIHGTD
jgi:hypothetical protein